MKIVGFQKISITSPTPHTDGTLVLHPHPAGISRRYLSYPPPSLPWNFRNFPTLALCER